jgi:hypothetical protein
MAYGSVPTGPSELYLSLLKGTITPEEYAKKAKKRAQEEARQRPVSKATKRQRA